MGGRVWARGGGRCGGQWASQLTAAGTSTATSHPSRGRRIVYHAAQAWCSSEDIRWMDVYASDLYTNITRLDLSVILCRFTERLPACLPPCVCVFV